MAVLSDYHLHSSFSGDSETPMNTMVEKAISIGLKEICFTEHQDFDFVYRENEPSDYFEINTDSYLYDILRAREKYGDKIAVLFGVELGIQPHLSERLADYTASHDFDFIIASSHLCHGKDPYYPDFFEGRSETDAYHEYFRSIAECIRSFSDFDVYGHLDYVLRYGPNRNMNFTMAEYQEDIDQILSLLIQMHKGIEVNSSGLRYGLSQPHPCRSILERYKELGGQILTIGSDAHKPEDIAADFEAVRTLLLDCGFDSYSIFRKRTPIQIKLS